MRAYLASPPENGATTLGGEVGPEVPAALTHTHLAVAPQIWYLLEGSYRMYKLFPSRGWEVHINLQVMHQSSVYTPNETMVTLFYEDTKLYQVPGGGGARGNMGEPQGGWLTPAHPALPSCRS